MNSTIIRSNRSLIYSSSSTWRNIVSNTIICKQLLPSINNKPNTFTSHRYLSYSSSSIGLKSKWNQFNSSSFIKFPILHKQTYATSSSTSSIDKEQQFTNNTKDIHEQITPEYSNPIDNPANHDYFFDENGKRRVTVHSEDLPDPLAEGRRHRRSFAAFAFLMLLTLAGIVKYEDANSPVVTSTLYTLRRSTRARQALGDNISFYSLFPWISGFISTVGGTVDFSYWVRASKIEKALVKFKAEKSLETGRFVVTEWSITPEGDESKTLSLIDEEYMPFIPAKNEDATSRHRSENY